LDYGYFDKLIQKHGWENEPAFDKVLLEIAPLPPMPGHPLGLYYPDPDHTLKVQPGTIWVPPESDEETSLHELGHRYGHYYYGDLSEEFAENFRKAHSPAGYSPDEDHTLRNIGIAIGVIAVSIIALSASRKSSSI
jgi:hypothetical protein